MAAHPRAKMSVPVPAAVGWQDWSPPSSPMGLAFVDLSCRHAITEANRGKHRYSESSVQEPSWSGREIAAVPTTSCIARETCARRLFASTMFIGLFAFPVLYAGETRKPAR